MSIKVSHQSFADCETLTIHGVKRGYRLSKFKPDYTTGGGYDVDVYERKA